MRAVLHPHVGTMVQGPDEVQRVLEGSGIALCLDTGHLLIGGTDPAELTRQAPERIAHTHMKDVDAGKARQVQDGRRTYTEAVREGMYRPLGTGDVDFEAIIRYLRAAGLPGLVRPGAGHHPDRGAVAARAPWPTSAPASTTCAGCWPRARDGPAADRGARRGADHRSRAGPAGPDHRGPAGRGGRAGSRAGPAAAARELGFERVAGSYAELLADAEVEVVYNPLANGLHGPWNLAAIAAGKHVSARSRSPATRPRPGRSPTPQPRPG